MREGFALGAVDRAGDGDGGRDVHQQVDVPRCPVELGEFAAEVRAHVWHDLLHALQLPGAEHLVPVLGDGNGWVRVLKHSIENMVPASVYVTENWP
jgi:hypothetical protein